MSMIDPSIDDLFEKVGSKYALVMMASKRARQIVENPTGALGPMVDPKNGKFEKKPVSIALEEIGKGLVTIDDGDDK